MLRRIAWVLLLPLLLLHACSEKESNPLTPGSQALSVPGTYASIQAAADAANPGDNIVVSYRAEPYRGDVTLPPDVSLMGHNENILPPRLEGRLNLSGGDQDVRILRLEITNDEGPGLVLTDSQVTLQHLWIHDCLGAAIELRGNSHAHVTSCVLEACDPALFITDVTATGHWEDEEHPAARIDDSSFVANGEPGALHNITFANIPVSYTIKVNFNYWGEGVLNRDGINATIYDNKDNIAILGVADTDHFSFGWLTAPITGDWWWE